ncbi:MAG: hypothetical protein K6D57_05000 [Paludibacteraceae bacterium]|jgi:hypothetical protein|nr:hypothetical protein [Paludibacteraceae bacterium]
MIGEILAYTIPSIVVGGVVLTAIHYLFSAEKERQQFDLKKENLKVMTPIRLRAYERMALFLERMTPGSLLLRQTYGNNISSNELHQQLLQQIRNEWEHNVSQQIYIQEETWDLIENAKESITELVNTCASEVSKNTVAVGLATLILDTYKKGQDEEPTPIDTAMDAVRKDIGKL